MKIKKHEFIETSLSVNVGPGKIPNGEYIKRQISINNSIEDEFVFDISDVANGEDIDQILIGRRQLVALRNLINYALSENDDQQCEHCEDEEDKEDGMDLDDDEEEAVKAGLGD